MITREKIRELARDDSVLSMCVYQADRGLATWEEAMMVAAGTLSAQNKVLMDELIEKTKLTSPPPILLNCKCMDPKL